MPLAIYCGSNAIIREVAKRLGVGILILDAHAPPELFFTKELSFFVEPQDVRLVPHKETWDMPVRHLHLGREYIEPLPLPPRALAEWCGEKTFEEIQKTYAEAGWGEELVLSFEHWRKLCWKFMQEHGEFPNRVLASELWGEAKRRGHLWYMVNHCKDKKG